MNDGILSQEEIDALLKAESTSDSGTMARSADRISSR